MVKTAPMLLAIAPIALDDTPPPLSLFEERFDVDRERTLEDPATAREEFVIEVGLEEEVLEVGEATEVEVEEVEEVEEVV